MIAHKVIQCPSGTCVCDTLPLQFSIYIYLFIIIVYFSTFLFLLRLSRLPRLFRTLWMGRVWKGGHRCSTPQTWPACFVALVLPFVQVPGLHISINMHLNDWLEFGASFISYFSFFTILCGLSPLHYLYWILLTALIASQLCN